MKFLSSHIYLEELDVDNLIHKIIGLKANTLLRQIFKIMFKVYSKSYSPIYIYLYVSYSWPNSWSKLAEYF